MAQKLEVKTKGSKVANDAIIHNHMRKTPWSFYRLDSKVYGEITVWFGYSITLIETDSGDLTVQAKSGYIFA